MNTELAIIDPKLRKQLAELQERLSRDMPAFADTGAQAAKQRREQCQDIEAFAKTYMPHYVPAEFNGMHLDLACVLDQGGGIFPVHGPREHGKSTIARAKIVQKVLYGRSRFGVIGSEKLSLAWDHILFLYLDLVENPRISADYAITVKQLNQQTGKCDLTIHSVATGRKHRIRLQAVSYETSAKGLLFMQHRPDFALLDDFENTRTARNQRIGSDKLGWVLQELYPAVRGPILWLGNTAFESSALYQAMRSAFDTNDSLKRWLLRGTEPGTFARTGDPGRADGMVAEGEIYPLTYRADTHTPEGIRYLWPAYHKPEWYLTTRRTMGNAYEGEMNGYPVKIGKVFSLIQRTQGVPTDMPFWFVWLDPAWGRSTSGSFKAWVVMCSDGRRFIVADAFCRQGVSMADVIDTLYAAFLRWEQSGLRYGRYEGVFGQDERLEGDLDLAEIRHGYRLNIFPDDNKGDKDARIQSLDGPVNTARIEFVSGNPDVDTVIEQLLAYPDSEFKDGPDALEACYRRLRTLARSSDAGQVTTAGPRRFGFRRHQRNR